VTADGVADQADLKRRVNSLANERSALFEKAGTNFGLSASDHQRLNAIERELDECFRARRQQRAVRDNQRFARDRIPRVPRLPPPPT
jgi:hypothetical protein